jgi:hypothetical protein
MSSTATQQDLIHLYTARGGLRLFPSFEHVVAHISELRTGTGLASTASYVLELTRNEDLAVYMALAQDNPRSVVWITRHSHREGPHISGGVMKMLDIPDSLFPRSLEIGFGQDFTEESIAQGIATMDEDMIEKTRWDSLSSEMKELWDLVHSNKEAVASHVHGLGQGTKAQTE